MEQQTGSKLGKEYVKAVYCHPAYLTYMQSTSCEMPSWIKHKMESKLLGEISITSDMQWHHTYGRKWRRASWWKWKRRVKKPTKLNIQKTKIMASGPFTSWQIDVEQWKQWQTSFWGDSKITADGDYSNEIKRCLLPRRKAMTNLVWSCSVVSDSLQPHGL